MTAYDLGRLQALRDSVEQSLSSIAVRKTRLAAVSPCGLTSLEYAELLGMALGGLESARTQIERMQAEPVRHRPGSDQQCEA